jgi:shikimate dehydrogenase
MHAAAFRALGLPHTYEAVRATAGELPAVVAALRDGRFDGLNVTVPHKRAVMALVDELDPGAAFAVNTLVRTPEGRVVGHNTDAPALAAELRSIEPGLAELSERMGDPCAIVLGSGGGACAAVAALAHHIGITPIVVRAREAARRDALLAQMRPALKQDARSLRGEALAPGGERNVEVVVQATSAGMEGAEAGDAVAAAIDWAALPDEAVAYDLVYAPPETPFLRAARARGLRRANGLGMLARQGALALELWLGVEAPLKAMRAALS